MSTQEIKKPQSNYNHLISASDTNIYKNSMRDTRDTYYLDYTFLSHRNSLSSTKLGDTIVQKDYLFDLQKTLELNMEILKSTIDEKNKEKYNQMISTFKAKKDLHTRITEQKSKILIEKQIVEELKRKMQENFDCYNDTIKDNEENMDGKEEHFQIMQKKLKEVEIYIHRNSSNQKTSLEKKFYPFKMSEFLLANTHLKRKKLNLSKEIDEIKKNIENIKTENNGIIEETKANNNTLEDENNNKEIQEYISRFKKQIHILQMRMKLLKNRFESMTKTIHSVQLNPNLFKEKEQEEPQDQMTKKNGNDVTQDKSLLPLNITRKINNLMDFSIVLNKRTVDDTKIDLEKTGGFGQEGFGNVTNINMWDISCINK